MAISLDETVIGSATSGDSFTLTSWTPAANDLILVSVAQRDESIAISVSGNGLTFVEVYNIDNTQGQNGIALFRAMGASPSTGQITVTVTGNTKPVVAVASRFSGCDTSGTNGSGAIEASATNTGPNPDDDDMLQSVTTLTNNAWAMGSGTHRPAVFTVPGGETAISINNLVGSGGDRVTCSTWYEVKATAGSVQLGATTDLDQNTDWTMGVVAIKPASGGGGGSSPQRTLVGAGV